MSPGERRRALLEIAAFGLCGGGLLVLLELARYRLLVFSGEVELYGAAIAAIAAAAGIVLGWSARRRPSSGPPLPSPSVTTPATFSRDAEKARELGITPRELEILEQIAAGLSNREIAARLFVSENTVKTHSRRLFDKLGARRRTQAVQLARSARLIP